MMDDDEACVERMHPCHRAEAPEAHSLVALLPSLTFVDVQKSLVDIVACLMLMLLPLRSHLSILQSSVGHMTVNLAGSWEGRRDPCHR